MSLIRSNSRHFCIQRSFSTSAVLFKKKKPIKRLIAQANKKPLVNKISSSKSFIKKSSKSKVSTISKEKKESSLPVLIEFNKQDLKKSVNLLTKITKFNELKLSPIVRDTVVKYIKEQTVLNAQNYENQQYKDLNDLEIIPSKIQVIAIHEMSKKLIEPTIQTFILAAETGSGKTWAYLAPLLDFLKLQEQFPDWEKVQNTPVIRSVILLPTHELVNQVHSNIKDLKTDLGLKTFKWDFNTTYTEFVNAFKGGIDILVTTPGKLNIIKTIKMISRPETVLRSVKFLVIDEADTLMDRSFIELTYESMRLMFNTQKLVFCSATISNQFNNALSKLFPSYSNPKLLISPTLHKSPKNIKYYLIDSDVAPYQGSKMKALAQTIYAIGKDGTEQKYEKRCIIFVNKKENVDPIVENLTKKFGYDVVGLTGNDKPEERSEKIQLFIQHPNLLEEVQVKSKIKTPEEFKYIKNSNIKILNVEKSTTAPTSVSKLKLLVTTDIAARGLNFFGVRNIILYDSPTTSTDLIHRVGRTGRMNQNGRVFIIADKKTKPWVKRFCKVGK